MASFRQGMQSLASALKLENLASLVKSELNAGSGICRPRRMLDGTISASVLEALQRLASTRPWSHAKSEKLCSEHCWAPQVRQQRRKVAGTAQEMRVISAEKAMTLQRGRKRCRRRRRRNKRQGCAHWGFVIEDDPHCQ